MQLISTIQEKCRMCYTCVRDCPAKAIRISGGQAEVIQERCIGCGNCVQVCSQNAKQYHNSIAEAESLLASENRVAAIIAPSFPADFPDMDYGQVVAKLRALGFNYVNEVAFGADLVAQASRQWMEDHPDETRISTACPAVVSYVEKYHPALVSSLLPICSPMVATARVLRALYGEDLQIVFIGPCFAKKKEADRKKDEINAVLTFAELWTLFSENYLSESETESSEFDEPHPGLGMLFPISRGSIQAAGIAYDLLKCDVIGAEGKQKFTHALKEFENGTLQTKMLEALCCNGCIMGPGMKYDYPYFRRRTAVSNYARQRAEKIDMTEQQNSIEKFSKINLSDTFLTDDNRIPLPTKSDIDAILAKMGKVRPEDELDCGACGYETCREHAIAIHKGLAESEMCLPYTIERLKQSLQDLNLSNEQLASTQQALINSEKLASMGQLSAGIAHEINNPLGVIMLYSKLLLDGCPADSEMSEDIAMIVEQADRCKTIVSGLLNFARKNKVELKKTNICELIDRCLKAIMVPQNIRLTVAHEVDRPELDLDSDQMIQVLTNLIMNAIEAMPDGGNIAIKTQNKDGQLELTVEDNGPGIPEKIIKKIFEPLFTTKQLGKGTGLGLAVTYGIVKMHRGQIDVQSNADPGKGATGTKFIVTLPMNGMKF